MTDNLQTQASQQRLILASSSTFRKALLERLRLPFECIASDIDESPHPNEHPEATAIRLSEAKAQKLLAQHPDAIVIGSDQVAFIKDDGLPPHQWVRLGKPLTHERAVEQLLSCSEQTVIFATGLWVGTGDKAHATCVNTTVKYKPITRDTAEKYIQLDDPLHCAGAIKSESLGVALMASQTGDDPNALIGLPLIATADFLNQLGVKIL